MIRRTLLLLAISILAGPLPAAAADDDPVAVVREVYRVHAQSEKTKTPVWRPPHRDRFFARPLARLLAEDDKRRESRMGFDPIYNAQDFKITGLDFALKSRQGEKAVVEARFRISISRRGSNTIWCASAAPGASPTSARTACSPTAF